MSTNRAVRGVGTVGTFSDVSECERRRVSQMNAPPVTVDTRPNPASNAATPSASCNVLWVAAPTPSLATMGFALPAAIAAALVRPEHRIVCFTGDGGIGMALAELETRGPRW